MLKITTPYFNKRIHISSESLKDAKENIIFHLLPYIVAVEDFINPKNNYYFETKLKYCKAMISFVLMDGILSLFVSNDKERNKFKTKAINRTNYKELFYDLYKIEYNHYIKNDGDSSIIDGLSYAEIKKHIKNNALSLIIMYFFTCNLLRLDKHGKENDYRIENARRLTNNITLKAKDGKNTIKLFSYDKIEKARKRYINVAPIIFGYIHTLIKYDALNIDLQDLTDAEQFKIFQEKLADLDETQIYQKYDDIIGYSLYAQKVLTQKVCKHADKNDNWFIIDKRDLKRYGFKEIEPTLNEFSDSELNIIKK